MKEELAFEPVESELCTQLGATRACQTQSESLSHCNGHSEIHNESKKRLDGSSSPIVYTRRVKPRNGFNVHADVDGLRCCGVWQQIDVANAATGEQSDGNSDASSGEVEVEIDRSISSGEVPDNELVEIAVQEDYTCALRRRESREELRILEEHDGLVNVVIQEDNSGEEGSWVYDGIDELKRPLDIVKIEERESAVRALNDVENTGNFNMEGDETGETDDLTKSNKLELKMSKKISLNKKLMTVRDLFETGLLEGVTVVYMGGCKMAPGLRGMIKDGGILCLCALCNGCRVIPPSQFEIHACKVYRRASQYICLENGKSLLEVLKACRGAPFNMLEAIIRSVVQSVPTEKNFVCKECKGTFPSTYIARTGPLCRACVESKKCQSTQSTPVRRARSVKSVTTSDTSTSPLTSISFRDGNPWSIKTRSSNKPLISESVESAPASVPPPEKTQLSPRADLDLKSSRSVFGYSTPPRKSYWKIISKSRKLIPKFGFSKSPPASMSSQQKNQWKITIKDQRLHKLVFEEDGLPDGTEVAYYAQGQKLLEGYKKGFGIFCRCCNSEVSPSQFEVHAGWASRKKPYSNIYTSNGVSLHELAISLSKGRKYSAKDNDNLCIICADGGNLLLCDGCPRAFHKECASLTSIPRGKWYCDYCQNLFQKEKFVNANAVAAGRVSGIDPIEQITRRCIRIVKNIGAEITGCALCRGYDFSKSGFGPRTIIICDQCEKEFHVGCLRDHRMANLKELPEGKWFCCMGCSRIHSTLQNLLVRGEEKLHESLLNIVRKKHEEKGLETICNFDVRWRLLSGSFACPESRRLLNEAVSIFHECFDPIVDPMTNRDLIPSMVNGRSTKCQEYGGMYCAVLVINSSVVSAGILRIFGQELAELPLVATRKGNHDKGYFQLLFSCIEKLLAFLNVKSLVLPAAIEAESIWTDKFGFVKIEPEQLTSYRKICSQMITFKGTSMLQKLMPMSSTADAKTC